MCAQVGNRQEYAHTIAICLHATKCRVLLHFARRKFWLAKLGKARFLNREFESCTVQVITVGDLVLQLNGFRVLVSGEQLERALRLQQIRFRAGLDRYERCNGCGQTDLRNECAEENERAQPAAEV